MPHPSYQRFTDRARKVMALANHEAVRLHHEYIGTEHLLLGLIIEGSGVAALVLKNLDIDLVKVRTEIGKLIQSGPEKIKLGRLPQTPISKRVIEYAIQEADAMKHDFVGTEHLLLGILGEPECVAANVLNKLGVKLEEAREELGNILGVKIEWNERTTSEFRERMLPLREVELRAIHDVYIQSSASRNWWFALVLVLLFVSLVANAVLAFMLVR
jgi:ATP-dependent Clp protease ATP-binding subunit ClpC